MFTSIVRFWANGWIYELYVKPNFHFKYFGFGWVTDWGFCTYILFIIAALSAAFVALGLYYRFSILIFFLSFTYIELLDKTTYLNHYYFISVLSCLMCFLPANAYFSLDNLRWNKTYKRIPSWSIDSIKLLISVVYVYAGLAKINTDWLLHAMPLKIWLPSKFHIPFIGETLLQQNWVHYVMSWGGMFYDLAIPFLLLYKRTRLLAFAIVVFFHVFTRVLFPIGMFPYIMIVSSLIFFDDQFHSKILNMLGKILRSLKFNTKTILLNHYPIKSNSFTLFILGAFFTVQLLFPFRYMLYPGELFWTEEGYRFSWRVMLIEKAGYANFKIVDGKTEDFFFVDNDDFLTSFQQKQMSFQPDFILEYAHYLGEYFSRQGHENVEVYVDCFVTLNGRPSSRFINSKINLYQQHESFKHKTWIIPFKDDIKGL